MYYGDECYSTSGQSGVCLTLQECPGMVDRARHNKMDLLHASCGFEKDVSLVCCSTEDAVGADSGDDLRDAVEEIENCPNLYDNLRANRSPYKLRGGSPTAAVRSCVEFEALVILTRSVTGSCCIKFIKSLLLRYTDLETISDHFC